MRAIEFLTESRNRMYQYIKSIVPTWPEYIVKDWLYQGFGRYNDENPKRKLLTMINREGLNRNTQWQFVPNMKFTMDNMWTSHTLRKLQGRAGGLSDMGMDVPRDAERHATQARLAQQQGGVRSEPVILIKRPDGYELLEGWHRTIQHFHKFPDGYTGPAYVAVAQSKQGVAEGFNGGDIELSHSMSPDILYVHVTSDGSDVGGARFKKIDGVWTGDIVHVYPQFRRQGVATKIYDYAEELVGKINPSKTLKPKGKKFWSSRDTQGVAEGIDDPSNLSRLQSVQSGRTALGLVNLPVAPSNDNPNNTAKVVNTGDRIMAVLNVRGVNIPYYISTGGGGKASVPTGKWYPVFGIHSSGWLNKGTEESINKFYGSKELARGAEILNKYLGDLRSVEDKIPLMKSDGYSIINKNVKPMSWHEVDSNVTEFKKRINAVLVQIGDAPHYPEVEYSKNDKKSQIVHLQNLAKFYPNITMKDFVNQGKEKIINDAMLEVNQLKNYYGQNKQANFVQLLSNLENDINNFKRGSLANTNNQNSVPNLGLLLKGTLGKINFATP